MLPLAGRLVSFCVKFSRFTIGDAGCDALDRLLSNPRLPLPEPGTRVIVSRDYFLAEEIETFERYLDSTESGSSGVDQTGGVVDAVGSP